MKSRFGDPDYSLDPDRFFAVRKSWHAEDVTACEVPAMVIFGRQDIVISDKDELDVLRQSYSQLSVHYFEKSAQYPHIEEAERPLRFAEGNRRHCLSAISFTQ